MSMMRQEEKMTEQMQSVILIVDDDQRNYDLLDLLLGSRGYQTLHAKDGPTALVTLADKPVDMVLLDVMMPGMSGFDVLERIRQNKEWQTLPVLLVTALSEKGDRLKGLELGADDFVSKPFDKQELLIKVNSQVKLSYLRRQLNEKEKLHRLIDQMEEGAVVTDPEFRPININRRARALLELDETPEYLLVWLRERFEGEFVLPTSSDTRQGTLTFLLNRKATPDSDRMILSVSLQAVINPSRKVDSYLFLIRDVTQEHLENKLRKDFLSLISHKLRTPLSSMTLALDLLKSQIEDQELLSFVMEMDKKQEELSVLILRLLYFVGIEKQPLGRFEEVQVINEILQHLTEKYPEKRLRSAPKILVSNLYVYQKIILEELLDNAVKFNDKDEVVLNIEITPEYMLISDNGPGIPKDERSSVFEAFYQVEKDFTGNIPGAGLGLTLVKKLVELHDGSIVLTCGTNENTTVRVNFM